MNKKESEPALRRSHALNALLDAVAALVNNDIAKARTKAEEALVVLRCL